MYLHNIIDALMRQAHDRLNALEHTLDDAARKQGENDSGRQRLFLDETRRQAAVHEERILPDSTTYLKSLPSGHESTDRFANRVAQESEPVRGGNGGELDERFQTQPRLESSGEAMAHQYMSATRPVATPADLSQTIEKYAGLVDDLRPSDPTRLLRMAISSEAPEVRPIDRPRDDTRNDPIGRLAARYTSPERSLVEGAVPEQTTIGQEAAFTQALADTFTSRQLRSHTETDATKQVLIAGNSQVRGQDQNSQFLRLGDQESKTHMLISNDRAVSSVFADMGEVVDQGDQRAKPSNHQPTFDRDSRWTTDDGDFGDAATNGSGREAMAAAADELERLRAAVRQTIDELERVRGSVQPPLPALPLNRGTFRIS